MKLKNNFAIAGFMGAGKTTLYEQIKDQVQAFDLDKLITKEIGSIKRYFENVGEQSFREIEFQTLSLLNSLPPHLIFLGGGSLEGLKTSEYIARNYQLIYLQVDLEVISSRLNEQDKFDRPLFKNVQELYNSRQERYLQSDFTINGNGHVDTTLSLLKEIIFE